MTRSETDRRTRFAHQRLDDYHVARGEVGECDACLDMIAILGLASSQTTGDLRADADRVAAMLTGVARRERRRADSGT